jgi:hypothetical protein
LSGEHTCEKTSENPRGKITDVIKPNSALDHRSGRDRIVARGEKRVGKAEGRQKLTIHRQLPWGSEACSLRL